MTPLVAYIYPQTKEEAHERQAAKFLDSYRKHKPSIPHELCLVLNGHPLDKHVPYEDVATVLFEHDDQGWDIGAYLALAKAIASHGFDFMVCLGGHSYFTTDGWLERMADVYANDPYCLYGATATREHDAHIRTTGFWCKPQLLAAYPHPILMQQDRLDFEYGERSLTRWAEIWGWPAMMVTKSYCVPKREWRKASLQNIYMRGDQSEILVRDRVSDEYDSWPEWRRDIQHQLANGVSCWPETQFSVSPPAQRRIMLQYDLRQDPHRDDGILPATMQKPLRRQLPDEGIAVPLNPVNGHEALSPAGPGAVRDGRDRVTQGQAQESSPAR